MSSLVLSTEAQRIWLEGTTATVYKQDRFQNYVLRPLSNSKKDPGIELAQHFKIRGPD